MDHTSYSSRFLTKVSGISQLVNADYSASLDRVIDVLFEAWKENKPVYVMGNGGSASTATHIVADLVKTICEKPEDRGIRAIALVDNIPLVSALVNDWGWQDVYVNQLATYYEPGGMGLAFSVHGGSGKDLVGAWSQNLLRGLQYIKDRGGKTIGFSGFDGGPMKDLVDVSIVVQVNSTPIVEGMHVVLHHLVIYGLKEKICDYKKASSLS